MQAKTGKFGLHLFSLKFYKQLFAAANALS